MPVSPTQSRGRVKGGDFVPFHSPLSPLDAACGDGFDEGTLGEEVEDEQGGNEHQRGGRNHLLLIAHRRAAGKPQLNGNVAVQAVGDGRGFKAQELDVPQVTYQRDVTIRVWHQPNPDSYAPHFHSAIEVCVPLLGGCEVTVSGKVYHVQAGEVLFVPSDATHALRMAAGSERYLIIFEHNAAFTMKEFAALRPMMRQPIYLTAECEATPIVRKTLMQLVDAYEAYTPLRNLRCYALLMDVFATLGELYLPNVANSAEMNDIHRRLSGEDAFNRALDYLNKNYAENITLDVLADYAGFSRYTLSRMFSRHTGATFIQYLNARRVDMAAEMLSQSDLPVTQVALRVGFGSIATFNRVFRTQKGCTPSQYRNVYLELKK